MEVRTSQQLQHPQAAVRNWNSLPATENLADRTNNKTSISYKAPELEQNISNKAIYTLGSIKGMAERAHKREIT
jgi:hypothetical protein